MLEELKIRYKNMLGVGNSFIEIDLTRSPSTLIYGKNGSSKSTLTDALFFAKFGKAFRDINKPTLVNTINKKECLVEYECKSNGIHHLIRRGIKPNIFEIYKNGELIPQDSKTLDYQTFLETVILKQDEKSARQISVLGSSSFKPFMQLEKAERRGVIEELLGLSIFAEMNKQNKQTISVLKTAIDELNTELKVQISTRDNLQASIDRRIESAGKSKEAKTAKLEEIRRSISESETSLEDLKKLTEADVEDLKKIDILKLDENIKKVVNLIVENRTKLSEKQTRRQFFIDNSKCPTCDQTIDSNHAEHIGKQLLSEMQTLLDTIKKLETIDGKLNADKDEWTKLNDKANESFQRYFQLMQIIGVQKNALEDYLEDINVEYTNENLDHDRQQIADINTKIESVETERALKTEDIEYYNEIGEMLKDDGVKANIIKHYLPKINKSINEYLVKFELPLQFYLDETFTEKIKSRGRESLGYYNFSEGEKKRIDLSIMFAWREIAKIKNNCNTNLLIMDEIFDASLDQDATDILLTVIEEMVQKDSLNIFVISHKAADQIYDKFRSAIQFKKINGFPRIV